MSAYRIWTQQRNNEKYLNLPVSKKLFCNQLPDRGLMASHLDSQGDMLDVLVPDASCRAYVRGVKYHVMSDPPSKSLLKITDNIAATSPELTFIQLASQLDFVELVYAGYRLCSKFYFDDMGLAGLAYREDASTTASKLRNFAETTSSIPGAVKARRAAKYIPHGAAASPPEIALAMLLTIPKKEGGFGLKLPEMNARVLPDKRALRYSDKSFYVCDLLWRDERLAIEYDSDAIHNVSTARANDARKREELENLGFRVITVTTSQLSSIKDMRMVAFDIGKMLGVRIRSRADDYPSRQERLHAKLIESGRFEGF